MASQRSTTTPTFKWKDSRDITASSEKSKFDNPRYGKTTTYRQNWINLDKQLRHHDHRRRCMHIDAILERVDEVSEQKDPAFLNLMFRLRVRCLILAYFPEGSNYAREFTVPDDHPGWKDFMTKRERGILKMLTNARDAISSGVTKEACDIFTEADKEFGWYRYQRWVSSLDANQR